MVVVHTVVPAEVLGMLLDVGYGGGGSRVTHGHRPSALSLVRRRR